MTNTLRGKMSAGVYKNYILGFIFYKYLSERLEGYVDEKLLHNEKLIFHANEDESSDIIVERFRW